MGESAWRLMSVTDPMLPPTLPHAAPVAISERIGSIDLLRGIAVLGILAMNIVGFALPLSYYSQPQQFEMTQGDRIYWALQYSMADGRFISIFSMLFGVGLCIVAERLRGQFIDPTATLLRRLIFLLCVGLIHAYLIWYGDILVAYALCGFGVMWLTRLRPGYLLLIGIPLLLLGLFFGWANTMMSAGDGGADLFNEAKEIAAMRGSYLDALKYRAMVSLLMQTMGFVFFVAPFSGGLMCIGIALYKLGIYRGRHAWLALALSPVLVLSFLDTQHRVFNNERHGILAQFHELIAVVQAVFYTALGGVLTPLLPRLFTLPLSRVGRMAFTNYLSQSLICTTIFYGYGLGHFGELGRVQLVPIVLSIWVFNIGFSLVWLQWFPMGPLEWVWRRVTYPRAIA